MGISYQRAQAQDVMLGWLKRTSNRTDSARSAFAVKVIRALAMPSLLHERIQRLEAGRDAEWSCHTLPSWSSRS